MVWKHTFIGIFFQHFLFIIRFKFKRKCLILVMLQQLEFGFGAFPTAQGSTVRKKTWDKRAWLSRPYSFWESSFVSAHLRPYFLFSFARSWQRGVSLFMTYLHYRCSSAFDSSVERNIGDNLQTVFFCLISICLNPSSELLCSVMGPNNWSVM